jgi:hypothetical protein
VVAVGKLVKVDMAALLKDCRERYSTRLTST